LVAKQLVDGTKRIPVGSAGSEFTTNQLLLVIGAQSVRLLQLQPSQPASTSSTTPELRNSF
jgi:hypothetical protein